MIPILVTLSRWALLILDDDLRAHRLHTPGNHRFKQRFGFSDYVFITGNWQFTATAKSGTAPFTMLSGFVNESSNEPGVNDFTTASFQVHSSTCYSGSSNLFLSGAVTGTHVGLSSFPVEDQVLTISARRRDSDSYFGKLLRRGWLCGRRNRDDCWRTVCTDGRNLSRHIHRSSRFHTSANTLAVCAGHSERHHLGFWECAFSRDFLLHKRNFVCAKRFCKWRPGKFHFHDKRANIVDGNDVRHRRSSRANYIFNFDRGHRRKLFRSDWCDHSLAAVNKATALKEAKTWGSEATNEKAFRFTSIRVAFSAEVRVSLVYAEPNGSASELHDDRYSYNRWTIGHTPHGQLAVRTRTGFRSGPICNVGRPSLRTR